MWISRKEWNKVRDRLDKACDRLDKLEHQAEEQRKIKKQLVEAHVIYPLYGGFNGWHYYSKVDLLSFHTRFNALLDYLALEWHEEPAHEGLRPKQQKEEDS